MNILRNLKITRVASVDKGAGEGVRILLMKNSAEGSAKGAGQMVKDAVAYLKASVRSIAVGDEDLLNKTFQEFETYVQPIVAASGSENPTRADTVVDSGGVTKKEVDEMTEKEVAALTKRAEDAEKALASMQDEIAFLKLAPKYQDFAKEQKMTAEDKKKFAAKSDADKDNDMDACNKRAVEQVPESVKKALADAESVRKVNEDLQKRLNALEADKARAALVKRATDLNLGADGADLLLKARSGDVEAVKKLEDHMLALQKQAQEAGLFKEFGSGATVGGNALAQLTAKAAELRKADPKLTAEKAFEKVYTDSANKELVTLYKREASSVAA